MGKNIFGILTSVLIFGFIFLTGLSGAQTEANKKATIFVSIPPLVFFAEYIGGNDFNIKTLIGPGQSPETFEITPRQFAAFADADLFFTVGVPFEKQLVGKIENSFKNLRIIDTQKGIDLVHMEPGHHHGGNENESGEENDEIDPHTWLDPSLAKIIALNIYKALSETVPERKVIYLERLNKLNTALDSLRVDLGEQLAPYKNRTFYVFHPAFGYFANAFGLKQVAVETGGKEPGAQQLAGLITQIKKEDIEILFVQPQFSEKSARTIADAVGAKIVPIDPLSSDYINNLKEITRQLVLAFKESR